MADIVQVAASPTSANVQALVKPQVDLSWNNYVNVISLLRFSLKHHLVFDPFSLEPVNAKLVDYLVPDLFLKAGFPQKLFHDFPA